MKRKTMNVNKFHEWANWLLSQPDSEYRTPEFRMGIATALEKILHETGNYHGFNFLEWLHGGCDKWIADGKPNDNTKYLGDQTKRIYY